MLVLLLEMFRVSCYLVKLYFFITILNSRKAEMVGIREILSWIKVEQWREWWLGLIVS